MQGGAKMSFSRTGNCLVAKSCLSPLRLHGLQSVRLLNGWNDMQHCSKATFTSLSFWEQSVSPIRWLPPDSALPVFFWWWPPVLLNFLPRLSLVLSFHTFCPSPAGSLRATRMFTGHPMWTPGQCPVSPLPSPAKLCVSFGCSSERSFFLGRFNLLSPQGFYLLAEHTSYFKVTNG